MKSISDIYTDTADLNDKLEIVTDLLSYFTNKLQDNQVPANEKTAIKNLLDDFISRLDSNV